jgi:hypothetical protein
MNAANCIISAKQQLKEAGIMFSSAKHCIDDAEACLARGDEEHAKRWALKSLAYSVGVMSIAYREASL